MKRMLTVLLATLFIGVGGFVAVADDTPAQPVIAEEAVEAPVAAEAVDGEAAPEAEPAGESEKSEGFDWNNLWQMILLGAFGCTFLGKMKKGDFNFKDLDWKKVAQKGIIGAIVGGLASWKGISLAEAEVVLGSGDGLAFGTLIIFGIDYALRAIFKGSAVTVKGVLGKGKGKDAPANPTDSSSDS